MGSSPLCSQSDAKVLTVLFGFDASFSYGSTGMLANSSLFSPPISERGMMFIAFQGYTNTKSLDPVDASSVQLTENVLVGPEEVGVCDPIMLQVKIFSNSPPFFLWDCPQCVESSLLVEALKQETESIISLGPELFSDFSDYEQINIRVQYLSNTAQIVELEHTLLKVTLPLPSLTISGPMLANAMYENNPVWIAEGKPSACDAFVLNNIQRNPSIMYLWNVSDPSASHFPTVTGVGEFQTQLSLQLQVWSLSNPLAISSLVFSVQRVPTVYILQLRILSEYVLAVTVGDTLAFSGMRPFGEYNYSLLWSCNSGGFSCVDVHGEILRSRNDTRHLFISAFDVVPGESIHTLFF